MAHGSPPEAHEAGGLPVLFSPSLNLAGQLPAADPGEQVTEDSAGAAPSRPRRTEKFRQTRWRRLALASASLAVAGTVAAHWSKGRADRAYERYLHAADSQRRERAIDRAERHDRLAGVGFLAMEAGLAACAYLVFF